jgi:hypothetical protein
MLAPRAAFVTQIPPENGAAVRTPPAARQGKRGDKRCRQGSTRVHKTFASPHFVVYSHLCEGRWVRPLAGGE